MERSRRAHFAESTSRPHRARGLRPFHPKHANPSAGWQVGHLTVSTDNLERVLTIPFGTNPELRREFMLIDRPLAGNVRFGKLLEVLDKLAEDVALSYRPTPLPRRSSRHGGHRPNPSQRAGGHRSRDVVVRRWAKAAARREAYRLAVTAAAEPPSRDEYQLLQRLHSAQEDPGFRGLLAADLVTTGWERMYPEQENVPKKIVGG